MSSSPENIPLPEKVRRTIDKLDRERRLPNIVNDYGTTRCAPNNTRLYRQYLAATFCSETLIETTAAEQTAFITITTNTRRTKWANRRLSKILEKHVAPHCIKWVRFFHRTSKGYVHWHFIVALKVPLLNTEHDAWVYGENIRRKLTVGKSTADGRKELESALSEDAKAMRQRIQNALASAGLGFIVRIEPIMYPDHISLYAAKYLSGSSKNGRYWRDTRVRLWSASKSARVANADMQVITPWTRIIRLKNAAYCALKGWDSMEKARRVDPKWQYHARDYLRGKKLRVYIYESDYVSQWGNRWSPRASGVRILYPHVRLDNGIAFQYFHHQPPSDPTELAALRDEWNAALEVPLHIWFNCGR